MSKRTKRIIGVIVAIIILLLLLLLLWLLSQRPDTAPINIGNQPVNTNQPLGSLNTSSGGGTVPTGGGTVPDEPEPEPEPADLRASLRGLAAAFAERYGSYSNQGDFENLEELQALMTDTLAAQTDEFIAGARGDGSDTAEYIGVTTRSINAVIGSYNEQQGVATVTVKTQREEVTSQGSRVYYQDLDLDFVLEGEIWKVSATQWVEEDG